MSGISLDIFEGSKNMFGKKISPEYQSKIKNYLMNPTESNWDEIHCIIIGSNGWTTMWQAVLEVNPNFVQSKPVKGDWAMIPTVDEIHEALFLATNK